MSRTMSLDPEPGIDLSSPIRQLQSKLLYFPERMFYRYGHGTNGSTTHNPHNNLNNNNNNNHTKERPILWRYSSLIVLPCSLKQIPFTVPSSSSLSSSPGGSNGNLQHPAANSRGGRETKSLDEGLHPGGSEPTTPTGKRPSVEIPGECIIKSYKKNYNKYTKYTTNFVVYN